jgi:hypothetical protein
VTTYVVLPETTKSPAAGKAGVQPVRAVAGKTQSVNSADADE